jgi:hypothetical protein
MRSPACLLLAACSTRPILPVPAPYTGFEAHRILAASDVHMVGTAYADGVLEPVDGAEDALVLVDPATEQVATVRAPNSVMSWPQILDVSGDGTWAAVAEVRGAPTAGTEAYRDIWTEMPPGGTLTLIDVDTGLVRQQGPSGATNPRSVSVHPTTGQILLPSETGELVLIDPANFPEAPSIRTAPVPPSLRTLGPVEAATWHPSRLIAILNLGNRHLAAVRWTGEAWEMEAGPLTVGRWLTAGRFGANEIFYVPDVGWGPSSASFLTNGPGALFAIAVQDGRLDVISEAEVGLSPEGFALSPDGRFAVTVNMRRTYLPDGWVGATPVGLMNGRDAASLSLLAIDARGHLTNVGPEVTLNAVLPEDAAFDDTSRTLVVTGFHGPEPEPTEGWLEVWRILEGESGPELRPTEKRWTTPRGPHDVVVVPRREVR